MEVELFREVDLPREVAGALYLHSMPGRNEALEDAVAEVRRLGISHIVSLAPLSEIRLKSPAYAQATEAATLPALLASCPIPDRGVPDNQAELTSSVDETASALKAGHKLLLHCGAGIGRTGTYAAAVLMRLGLSMHQAIANVGLAGSHPETEEQLELLISLSK
jgi:protein-tyrosine phosphatase